MDDEAARQTILERFIRDQPALHAAVHARYCGARNAESSMRNALLRIWQPLIDAGQVRQLQRTSALFTVNHRPVPIAFRILLQAPGGVWRCIDHGRTSLQRPFEHFIRRMLIAEHLESVRAYLAGSTGPEGAHG